MNNARVTAYYNTEQTPQAFLYYLPAIAHQVAAHAAIATHDASGLAEKTW